jgi:chromosome segregation ATPase
LFYDIILILWRIGGARMTNEEFQKIVLAEIKALREEVAEIRQGQLKLEQRQSNLEQGQLKLEQRQSNLEQGQEEIKRELKAVIQQTADLTEFREETNAKLDTLIDENDIIKEINGRHEVDIKRLKRRII